MAIQTKPSQTYYGMDISELCINTIRTLSMDGVQKANSGHPGTPMANAPLAYLLYTEVMRHNPRDPQWPNRDRFILSAGHASMLLYSSLYLTGYDVSLDDLKNFRQWGSQDPGPPRIRRHPRRRDHHRPSRPGLRQRCGHGPRRALAGRALQQARLQHRQTTTPTPSAPTATSWKALASEAASIAGFLKLGKLIYFYDDNTITIDGHTDLAFSEDVGKRFEAYGWHVQHVSDVNDLDSPARLPSNRPRPSPTSLPSS